jgi:hypothetical protein
VTATCPYCSDELDVPPAFAGRPVRCGSCHAVFTPPTFGAASPEWLEPDAPRPARRVRREPPPPPRGSAGVWGLALLTLILTVPCTAGCVWAVVVFGFPHFQPVADDVGRYRALFPGHPSPINRKDDGGRLVRGYDLRRTFPPETYFVYYVDLPKAAGRDAADVLAAETKGLAEFVPPGATEAEREAATHDGFPAVDVLMDSPDPEAGTVVVRCVLAGTAAGVPRLYVVGLAGPVGPDDTRAKRFFGGFRVTAGK